MNNVSHFRNYQVSLQHVARSNWINPGRKFLSMRHLVFFITLEMIILLPWGIPHFLGQLVVPTSSIYIMPTMQLTHCGSWSNIPYTFQIYVTHLSLLLWYGHEGVGVCVPRCSRLAAGYEHQIFALLYCYIINLL